MRDALAELTAAGTDRLLRADLTVAPPRASVPGAVVDEVVPCPGVSRELAWQYVDRFAPNAAAHLVGLRPGDATWVAQVVRREPAAAVLDVADPATLAAAAP